MYNYLKKYNYNEQYCSKICKFLSHFVNSFNKTTRKNMKLHCCSVVVIYVHSQLEKPMVVKTKVTLQK